MTGGCVFSQDLYLVEFTDKEGQSFEPFDYFDPHKIERRKRLGLPLADFRDYPVREDYVRSVASVADSLRHRLRWFNAVSVRANQEQVARISRLPFVKNIHLLGAGLIPCRESGTFDVRSDTLLDMVRDQLELDSLSAHGLDGSGVRIAIFDVGFKEVPSHPSLQDIWKKGQVLRTRDFYGGDSMVYHHDIHGTQVLACIAGTYKGENLGAGKNAEFLLARTEHRLREKPVEEDNWLAAVEWADRWGADIINSSLGYTRKRYDYEEMDGKTALVSRAAKMAAEKGILVVVSNGNAGAQKWKYLGAPADVPEVLSVGGSLPMTPRRIPFSSLGPNALGHTKPDVAAPGFAIGPVKKGKMDEVAGTSYSAPLIAGMAACLMQLYPEAKPVDLINMFHKIGHFYPYYDYELGYGIPKAGYIPKIGSREEKDSTDLPSFDVFYRGDSVIVRLNPEVMNDSAGRPFGPVIYAHLEDEEGKLTASFTVPLENRDRYWYFMRRPGSRGILRIWFEEWLYEERWE